MRPAIFLDRDGTLNFDYGWITSPSKIELLPGAGEAVRAINDAGYLAVLITNQPVIARGECTIAELDQIHEKLKALLAEAGAHLDAIYYCPHHPDLGIAGERPEYKIRCDCRKPAPGLLESASRDLKIDVERSWMIGDSERDLGAACCFWHSSGFISQQSAGFQRSDFVEICVSRRFGTRSRQANFGRGRVVRSPWYIPWHTTDMPLTTTKPTAKVFRTGRSQAVRLPKAFQFDVPEVFIRRNETTGEVILSARDPGEAAWKTLLKEMETLSEEERNQFPERGVIVTKRRERLF